ncbi:MAG: bifunctional molybdenum cofactor biosynthesis protein MoaC/MoaB [Planctomycetota bacterium]
MPDHPKPTLSHTDGQGRAVMVDVGGKPVTDRRATAEGRVSVGPEVAAAIRENSLKKGDLLSVARLGGVQAAKRTADLVLLCHPLPLSHIDVDASLEGEDVVLRATTRTASQTGVEMEALAAVTGAALNVVDMGKALNPSIEVVSLRVVDKIGGKTGLASNKTTDADRPTVAILTVSDSRSAGDRADTATRLLAEAAETLIGARVVDRAIAPDDRDAIAERLRAWTEADGAPRLVLTTGGAGVGPRDVTPEATADVVERRHEGLLELARSRCLPGKPEAFLSRAIAGVAGRTLVVNLPGSPRGAVDTLRLMSDVLPHALDALRDPGDDHPPA